MENTITEVLTISEVFKHYSSLSIKQIEILDYFDKNFKDTRVEVTNDRSVFGVTIKMIIEP